MPVVNLFRGSRSKRYLLRDDGKRAVLVRYIVVFGNVGFAVGYAEYVFV